MTSPTFSRGEWIKNSVFHPANEADVLKLVTESAKSTPKSVVLLDLDSTLYEVAPRTLGILSEWASSVSLPPHLAQLFKQLQKTHLGYSVKDTFEKLGLALHDESIAKLYEHAKDFWWERFFTNSYLPHDKPYTGAVSFVNHLYKTGTEIIYLTGRESTMRKGTESNLLRDGFPWNVPRTHLFMRENSKHTDLQHKIGMVDTIQEKGKLVASFENEPLNLMNLALKLPEAVHVFVDTVCSDQPAPPGQGLYRISGFHSFQD